MTLGDLVKPLIRPTYHGVAALPRIPSTPVIPSPQIAALLAKPTWSVKSLLPSSDAPIDSSLTKEKLCHLLRLSALPSPKSTAQESKMLETLSTQIHFIKEIQKVDTTGVAPLRSIRDETKEGIKEQTVTLNDLKEYFAAEERTGRNGKIKRKTNLKDEESEQAMSWDAFAMSEGKIMGRYFYIKREKKPKPPIYEAESSEPAR